MSAGEFGETVEIEAQPEAKIEAMIRREIFISPNEKD
jgi:hypothetical protein